MTTIQQLLGMIDDWKHRLPPSLFYTTVIGWKYSEETAMAGWELFCKVRRQISMDEIHQYMLNKREGKVPEIKPKNYRYIDVRDCRRCGADHDHVLFQQLSNPIDGKWKWWGMCPVLSQPVLLGVVEMK